MTWNNTHTIRLCIFFLKLNRANKTNTYRKNKQNWLLVDHCCREVGNLGYVEENSIHSCTQNETINNRYWTTISSKVFFNRVLEKRIFYDVCTNINLKRIKKRNYCITLNFFLFYHQVQCTMNVWRTFMQNDFVRIKPHGYLK